MDIFIMAMAIALPMRVVCPHDGHSVASSMDNFVVSGISFEHLEHFIMS
jgi:hypothetical protein